MTLQAYSEPVNQLLNLGYPTIHEWPDYLAMGLTSADVPELIRLVQDEELRWMEATGEEEDIPEWYAQIHAWRALAQLNAEESVPALVSILHQVDDYDDDWTGEELTDVFAMIGPAAIPPLAEYVASPENKTYARGAACGALKKIAEEYPESREDCVAALVKALELFERNDETINAFIIWDLVDLKAVEQIDLIEEAFKAGNVEEMVGGDFEDVQIELGLMAKRKTPPRYSLFSRREELSVDSRAASSKRSKQEKAKRKQEKLSRKKNRKKKKK